jgi:hypothetical protein
MLSHADLNREVARIQSLAQRLMIRVIDRYNDTEIEGRIVLDREYNFRVQEIEVFASSD